MVLASQFAPIRRIWAGFCASARGAHRGAIHERAIPIDLVRCLEFCKQHFEELLPNACLLPLPKIAPAGLSAGKIAGRRKPAPGNAGAEHEKDPGEQPTRLRGSSSRKLHMPFSLGFGIQGSKRFQRSSGKTVPAIRKTSFRSSKHQLKLCQTNQETLNFVSGS